MIGALLRLEADIAGLAGDFLTGGRQAFAQVFHPFDGPTDGLIGDKSGNGFLGSQQPILDRWGAS